MAAAAAAPAAAAEHRDNHNHQLDHLNSPSLDEISPKLHHPSPADHVSAVVVKVRLWEKANLRQVRNVIAVRRPCKGKMCEFSACRLAAG